MGLVKERNIVLIIIVAIFVLYLLGNYLGINGEVVSHRFCTDSDDGKNIYMPGHVVSDIGEFRDRCNTGSKTVREYYCGKGLDGRNYKVMSNFIECGYGYYCERDVVGQDDACVKD